MDEALLLSLLKDVVVPEVASFISAHFAKTGELPTQEQLQQQVDSLSTQILAKAAALTAQAQADLNK